MPNVHMNGMDRLPEGDNDDESEEEEIDWDVVVHNCKQLTGEGDSVCSNLSDEINDAVTPNQSNAAFNYRDSSNSGSMAMNSRNTMNGLDGIIREGLADVSPASNVQRGLMKSTGISKTGLKTIIKTAEKEDFLKSRLYAPASPSPTPRRRTSVKPALGGRTKSIAVSLSQQGYRKAEKEVDIAATKEFAVTAIDRGSEDWHNLLKPFVSDLAFRSVRSRHQTFSEDITFQTYSCQAAALFVDLSGYSKITSAVAHKGPHMISTVVNAYLERLLKIIYEHGGDVIKFAGDAVMAVWEGTEQDLELNVLCAARCAVELQINAGEHAVEGTPHKFQIHIGLSCGPLESEVFEAPSSNTMQRLYHSIGGEAMNEIGDLVDLAACGEVAISLNCLCFLDANSGSYEDIEGVDDAKLLAEVKLDDELVELMDQHICNIQQERKDRRQKRKIEEDFIHASVLDRLSHGGLTPTQIAEIRNLCVLFIAMTSNGSSVNWLMEVQTILDRNRCPIVQIIDDDKGVHLVAAVNLYEAVPETSLVGIEVCRELKEKRVGASVGAAIGETFCGVTGSSLACRWDITGYAVVRAARLMQLAMARDDVEFVLDQSLYEDPMAATHMTLLDSNVQLKGSPGPIAVYELSDARNECAFRIMEKVHGGVHNAKVQDIQNHIECRIRSAVVVTGIPLAGKKIACQRAAGFSDLIPYRHLCDVAAGFLQLGRTIATWYQYNQHECIREQATNVLEDMDKGRWSCAHDSCVKLIDNALEKGCRACFLVDRLQFLDRFSLSLIRECLRPRGNATADFQDPYSDEGGSVGAGKLVFLCVHVPSYNSKSAQEIVNDIIRSHTFFKIPIVDIGEASKDELRTLVRDLFDVEVEDRWLDAYAEASGYCAGYFIERAVAVQNLSLALWREGKPALCEMSDDLTLRIPPGLVRLNKELTVKQIRPEIAMRYSQIYDELPPMCQFILKILTIATRKGFYKLPRQILWEVMNDLIAKGVARETLENLLDEMLEIFLIRIDIRDDETIQRNNDVHGGEDDKILSVQSPALANIAMDVCTPLQVESIAKALIARMGSVKTDNFEVPLAVASLHKLLNRNDEVIQELYSQAYAAFLKRKSGQRWSKARVNKWTELIFDEIKAASYDPEEILGPTSVSAGVLPVQNAPNSIFMINTYRAPVSLGPMGHTLSVIARHILKEYGKFHGAPMCDYVDRNLSSACGRYIMEMSVLEEFLSANGCGAAPADLEGEADMMSFMSSPAGSDSDVETKAMVFLEEIVPRFIENRLQRLYKLLRRIQKTEEIPWIMETAPKPIRLAYLALQAPKNRTDAAQDALMLMATLNWTPKSLMEFLPLKWYQTVGSIRNETLQRDESAVIMERHQQTVDDLEVFLIVTALMGQASEQGMC